MAFGNVGFSQLGNVNQPSPSIWGDSPNQLLLDLGLGGFIEQGFRGDYPNLVSGSAPGIESVSPTGTSVYANAASGTYGPHVLSMATGGTDNNNTAIFAEELGPIILKSGQKFWFEARIALAALGDAAFFVGLTTRAGVNTATTGLIAADPSNSAAAATVGVSNIGFISAQASSAIATVNAVYKKGAGPAVTVLADVTNATALQAEQAAQPVGVVITQAAAVTAQTTGLIGEGIQVAYGNMVAASFRKFGVRFDGMNFLEFYVDGVLVARQTVDSTVDQTSYYVPTVVLKTGTGSAVTALVDFIRAGYQQRS